jgi:hypothetical protein
LRIEAVRFGRSQDEGRRSMPEQNEFSVEKWDRRHWALFEGDDLVCVTVYKKGALEVKRRLEQKKDETLSAPAVISPGLHTILNSVLSA